MTTRKLWRTERWPDHGDACPGAALRIEVDDLEGLESELRAKAYGYAQPAIEAMPWGTRDMCVTDPFGNRLTFTSAIFVARS